MSEPNGAAAGQEPASAQPQAGDGAPQAGAPEAGGTQITDLSTLQRELNEARSEAAKARKELKGYKDAETAAAEAAKSELQRATDRAEAAEKARDEALKAHRGLSIRLATVEAARRLGFRNPEIAHRLISDSEIEYADSGEPKNIDALLTKIATSDPYLVNGAPQGRPDLGGGPRGGTPGPDMNTLLRRAAGRG